MMTYVDNVVTLLIGLEVDAAGNMGQSGVAVCDAHEFDDAPGVWIEK